MASTVRTPISGKEGRMTLAATNLFLSKWAVDPRAEDLPNRNFESGGFDEGTTGFVSAKINCDSAWHADQNPHASPLLIRAGQIITGPVYLYVRKTGNRRFTFSEIRILGTPVTNEANGLVTYQFEAMSNGPWTYPT